jgi:hypothetical protein
MINTPFGDIIWGMNFNDSRAISQRINLNIEIKEVDRLAKHIHDIDGRYKVTICATALKEIKEEFYFYCAINPSCIIADSSTVDREYVKLKSWYSFNYNMLTIGVEDCEKLFYRSRQNDAMPTRFNELFRSIDGKRFESEVYGPIYENLGMRVKFPNLQKEDVVSISFGVAWYRLSDAEREDLNTFFGADPNYM